MKPLRIKIKTAHCNTCGHITGRDERGNCMTCTRIQAEEYKAREKTPEKIGQSFALIAQGYKPHSNPIDCEAAMASRCKLCAGACYYMGFQKGSSYIAISRCVRCGTEREF